MPRANSKSLWLTAVLVPIVVALITSPYIYDALNRGRQTPPGPRPGTSTPSGQPEKPPDPPPPEPTDNWAGSWACVTPDHRMTLTITGKGRASSLKAYYPVAFGNQPATEDYTISDLAAQTVSGEYIYYDKSPTVGYQGRQGVWNGEWSMTVREDSLKLIRRDHTSGWVGEYECARR